LPGDRAAVREATVRAALAQAQRLAEAARPSTTA